MKSVLAGLLLSVVLLGCTGKGVVTIIEDGKTTTYTGDAIQKHLVYAEQRRLRDEQTEKMYNKQGVVVENEMYILSDGSSAYLPKKITARAPHRWQQNIETKPPEHRAWKTVDKALGIAEKGLFITGLNEILGTTDGSQSTRYEGDYSPRTAKPFVVHPEIVDPVIVEPVIIK